MPEPPGVTTAATLKGFGVASLAELAIGLVIVIVWLVWVVALMPVTTLDRLIARGVRMPVNVKATRFELRQDVYAGGGKPTVPVMSIRVPLARLLL